MSEPIRVIGLCGSLRAGSLNRKLLELAARQAREAGAEVDLAEAAALELPLYNGDLDGPVQPQQPAPVVALKARLARAQALVIASPEYNYSFSGVLKNAIDWASRPIPTNPFRGKPLLIMSASGSPFGGVRGAPHVRDVMGALGSLVIGPQVHVAVAHQAFDEAGGLKDPNSQKILASAVGDLLGLAGKLRG